MPPARGDSKYCTQAGCPGRMRFSEYARPLQPEMGDAGPNSPVRSGGEQPGWVCMTDPHHFERGSAVSR